MKVPFNKAPYIGNELEFMQEAIAHGASICGNGKFTQLCEKWFENSLECKCALMTPSCTHALEMASILIDIKEGDEVIMPSYTFVSTANAFVLRGAKIVFVDIRPDTMNIDETKIETAITNKTKAIVPVHYAGVACEMDTIMQIAAKYNLYVIEDAAQAMNSKYKGKYLGTFGHLGTYSFHETKNYTSAGEGGLLIVNDSSLVQRSEIIREKGTNRSAFFRGIVDKYTWVDIGSSYLLNDVSAAYLWAQLEKIELIQENRLKSWNIYFEGLKHLAKEQLLELPKIPESCTNNAHIFYIKLKNIKQREALREYLNTNGISSVFHYIPLHSSPAGKKFGIFNNDIYTTQESEKLLRLPIYYGIEEEKIKYTIEKIKEFLAN